MIKKNSGSSASFIVKSTFPKGHEKDGCVASALRWGASQPFSESSRNFASQRSANFGQASSLRQS
jgi:hypothetical protein